MRDQMESRCPSPLRPSGHKVQKRKEQFGGNFRSILWRAELATLRAACRAPETAVQGSTDHCPTPLTAASGFIRQLTTLVLFEMLLWIRG
jgi:hypothetical protein